MTPDFPAPFASRRPSMSDERQAKPRNALRAFAPWNASSRFLALVASSVASALIAPFDALLLAQPHQESPVVPSSTIGPVTNSSTFSVLGVTALPEAGASIANRNVLWFGATQPIGRVAGVRIAAIGSGFFRPSDAVGARDAAEGTVSLRALARVNGVRTWTAVSYGRSSADGNIGSGNESLTTMPVSRFLANASRYDTTISLRHDVGTLTRAEIGMLTASGPVEFSFGVSVERATRVTTQSLGIAEPTAEEQGLMYVRSQELERRDMATGLASASFRTGSTDWLISVSSPIANWVDRDADAPRPQRAPAVASIAFMQPLTAWLSVVGAASTNATTVGSYAIRDERADGRRRDFAPVVALGVRIARFSMRNSPGEPAGILAFETRTVGIIDAVTAELLSYDSLSATHSETGRELVRVLLLIDAPRAESVELMGDATGWSVTSLSRTHDGKWRAELHVAPGMHRLAVRSDGGTWIAPPGMPMSTDDFGGRVGLLVVKLRNN